jgi:DNA helicase-2/ATP-dependent DNA helicase PcrA
VEFPFDMVVEGVLVRGRIDAVFADAADGCVDVVDWKTGQRPHGGAAESAAVQLAAYRLAWHAITGTPLDRVRAAFHYVPANETVRPVDLLDSDELAALIRSVPLATAGDAGDRSQVQVDDEGAMV